MKKFILLLLMFGVTNTIIYSQVENKLAKFPDYQGVVIIQEKSANDIYAGVKLWVASNFKSANDVIQLDDKENGIMVVKGNSIVYFTFVGKKYPARVHFTLKIEVKDNKFRYTFLVTDVVDESGNRPISFMNSMVNKPDKASIKEVADNIVDKFNDIINKIYSSMLKAQSDNDW